MENSDLEKAYRLLETAESSIKAAKLILDEIAPENFSRKVKTGIPNSGQNSYEEGENQIVEGIFDGQNMIGPDSRMFPVPPNYCSKSKLVEGDKLKLTILPNGTFLYKQIDPVERKTLKGALIKEDGIFKVATDDGTYKVILAAVTYFKGTIGDEVTIVVPENRHSSWAAIEAIIPQMGASAEVNEEDTF